MKNSELKLLRSEIERIHQNGSGDYQTLMKQIGKQYRVLRRNAAQTSAMQYAPYRKKMTMTWSRGVGKTTLTADMMDMLVHGLPRGVVNLIVPSYKKFKKEMLPALRKGLEMLGYFEGIHYFIGRRPPLNWKWDMPYMCPDDFTNIIYWYNGTIFQLISQDVDGSGRALSVDAEIKDEAAMLNKMKLDATSGATLRGSNVDAFLNNPFFGASYNLTSMPITLEGAWIFDEEKNAIFDPKNYYYSEFNVGVNLANLRPGYVTDALKTALFRWVFDAEFLNIRPTLVMGAYYALLKESKHGYMPVKGDYREHEDCQYDYADDDLREDLPLILGVDWGSRINYMCVCQLHENGSETMLRALNEFWALGEEGEVQSDMVAKFAKYYEVYKRKKIILFCDRQGNHKTGLTIETRIEMLTIQLNKLGWDIQLGSHGGANPLHSVRRILWETILKEENKSLPKFRVNLLKCRNLLVSMQNTQTKSDTNKVITKNKSSEKPNSNVHPTHASDPSDGVDHILIGLCGQDFVNQSSLSLLTGFSNF